MDQRSERCRRRRSSAHAEAARAGGQAASVEGESSFDEASADMARNRLRERGIVAIEPDERIAALLAPNEVVVAVRPSVRLERRQSPRDAAGGLAGDLYITSQRLVHLGRLRVDYSLDEIRDAIDAPHALRLIVGEARGIEIDVEDPRALRVEIAAVRVAARAAAAAGAGSAEIPDGQAVVPRDDVPG